MNQYIFQFQYEDMDGNWQWATLRVKAENKEAAQEKAWIALGGWVKKHNVSVQTWGWDHPDFS